MAPVNRIHPTLACVIMTLSAWAIAFWYAQGFDYSVEVTLWLSRITGYTTLALLLGSLTITPLQRLGSLLQLNTVKLKPYRRSMGITAFCSGLGHALIAIERYFGEAPWFMPLLEPFLRFGVLTLTILLVLWMTSFPKMLRFTKLRTWRELHWLAYAACITATMHVVLAPFAPVRIVLIAFAGWAIFALLRFLPKSR